MKLGEAERPCPSVLLPAPHLAEQLRLVDELIASVVPRIGPALGVLVGHARAQRLHHLPKGRRRGTAGFKQDLEQVLSSQSCKILVCQHMAASDSLRWR